MCLRHQPLRRVLEVPGPSECKLPLLIGVRAPCGGFTSDLHGHRSAEDKAYRPPTARQWYNLDLRTNQSGQFVARELDGAAVIRPEALQAQRFTTRNLAPDTQVFWLSSRRRSKAWHPLRDLTPIFGRGCPDRELRASDSCWISQLARKSTPRVRPKYGCLRLETPPYAPSRIVLLGSCRLSSSSERIP